MAVFQILKKLVQNASKIGASNKPGTAFVDLFVKNLQFSKTNVDRQFLSRKIFIYKSGGFHW